MTMNEKYFPKRARFIITNKLIDSIMNVSANFFAANAIYPNNEEKLKIREQYQIIGKANLSALEINEKKTRIVKATHVITYLKTRFNLLRNGEVIRRPNRKSITMERKKLKKLKKKLDEGVITFSDVRNSYESWKGSLKGKKCYRTLQNMNKLFNELFIEDWRFKYDQ